MGDTELWSILMLATPIVYDPFDNRRQYSTAHTGDMWTTPNLWLNHFATKRDPPNKHKLKNDCCCSGQPLVDRVLNSIGNKRTGNKLIEWVRERHTYYIAIDCPVSWSGVSAKKQVHVSKQITQYYPRKRVKKYYLSDSILNCESTWIQYTVQSQSVWCAHQGLSECCQVWCLDE